MIHGAFVLVCFIPVLGIFTSDMPHGDIIGIAVFATILSEIGPVKKINKMDIVNVVNAQ